MGGFAEYGSCDGLGLAALVAKKDVSPAELLEEAIARTEKIDGELNAVVLKHYDLARQAVKAGLPEGPFRGVPFLLKDLHVGLTGTRTTSGSRACAGLPEAETDSTFVARCKAAGLVIFGKTNSPELGLAGTTEPELYGPTLNPWDTARSPGGSSGGAAAAAAAGIVPLAHASDGGGSIRIPAAACGLFGLKPTRARTPIGPMRGEGWAGMSISHAVSHSVRDSAALLDALEGFAPGDPYCAPGKERRFADEVGRAPGRLRIAVNARRYDGSRVPAAVEGAVAEAARLCEELGHHVEEARPALDPREIGLHQINLISANTALALDELGAGRGRPVGAEEVQRITWRTAERGRTVSGMDYVRGVNFIHDLGRRLAAFHETYDVYLCPVLGAAPFALGKLDMSTGDIEAYAQANREILPFTGLANMTGQPSMSVPLVHDGESNLPLGVMFTGRFGADGLLFRLAAQLEEARPWAGRRPPIRA